MGDLLTYSLGVDLGTTFSAAATCRNGVVETVSLGPQSAAIPSAIYVKPDGETLVGDAALRRGREDPLGLARHFKRRMGDRAPILLSGRETRPEELTAALLRHVVDLASEREGEAPAAIAVTHPANWGDYKRSTMREAIDLAGLPEAKMLTEPEAAAIAYAARGRIDTDDIVAVYDLGGGTFDVALLRRTADGFDLVGRPDGIEHLGGIDFDFAVRSWALEQAEIDPADLGDDEVEARVRGSSVISESEGAKIALSSDVDTTLELVVDGEHRPWRLTRSEFEAMVRPSIEMTLGAVRRTLEAAGLEATDIDKVLLVGGSSRIPLIGGMLSETFGRPVAVDADPKAAICGGAALSVDPSRRRAAPPPVSPPAATSAVAAVASPAATEPADPALTAVQPAIVPAPAEPIGSDARRSPWAVVGGIAAAVVVLIVGAIVLVGGDDDSSGQVTTASREDSIEASTSSAESTQLAAPDPDPAEPTSDGPGLVGDDALALELLETEDFFNRTYDLDCYGVGSVPLTDGGFEDPGQGLFVALNDVIIRDFDFDGVDEAVALFGCFIGANGNTDQALIFEVSDGAVQSSGNVLIAEEGFIVFDEPGLRFLQSTPADPSEPSCCVTQLRQEGFFLVDDGSGATFTSDGVEVVPNV